MVSNLGAKPFGKIVERFSLQSGLESVKLKEYQKVTEEMDQTTKDCLKALTQIANQFVGINYDELSSLEHNVLNIAVKALGCELRCNLHKEIFLVW